MTVLLSTIIRSLFVDHLPITLVSVLGLAAVYLLLPRPRGYPPFWGAAAGVLALLLAGVMLVHAPFTAETVLFYAFSGVAVVAGALLVTQRNPARAALAFALVVLSTCGLFLLLAAPFLMAATAIIYAGAIVVTFLFVIMLAQQEGLSNADQRSREPLLASVAGFLLLGSLLYVLAVSFQDPERYARLGRVQQFLDEIGALGQTAPRGGEQEKQLAAELKDFLEEFHPSDRTQPSPARMLGGKELADAVYDAKDTLGKQEFRLRIDQPIQWEEITPALLRVGTRLGGIQPREGAVLSTLSGPAPNEPLRRDAQGRPQLPAENTAYLGRSLFTDFLVAVELGGTLLLVATVGAIAIAHRRAEGSS